MLKSFIKEQMFILILLTIFVISSLIFSFMKNQTINNVNIIFVLFSLCKLGFGIFIGNLLTYITIDLSIKEKLIPRNKKAIYPFSIIYLLFFLIVFIDLKMKFIENTRLVIILYVFFISLIIISHLYIKITTFNFNLSIKMLGFTLLLFIISYSPMLFYANVANVGINLIRNFEKLLQQLQFFILDLAIDFIYPSFFEEYLFRGLLLSALLGFGVNILKANMIQAILFGLIHFNHYPDWGLLCFVPTVQQMLIGFLLGKLYIKTKSLTPSIIFHVLWNNIPLLLF